MSSIPSSSSARPSRRGRARTRLRSSCGRASSASSALVLSLRAGGHAGHPTNRGQLVSERVGELGHQLRHRPAPPSPAARTTRLPTITPSAISATARACSAVEMPKPDRHRHARSAAAHALHRRRQLGRQLVALAGRAGERHRVDEAARVGADLAPAARAWWSAPPAAPARAPRRRTPRAARPPRRAAGRARSARPRPPPPPVRERLGAARRAPGSRRPSAPPAPAPRAARRPRSTRAAWPRPPAPRCRPRGSRGRRRAGRRTGRPARAGPRPRRRTPSPTSRDASRSGSRPSGTASAPPACPCGREGGGDPVDVRPRSCRAPSTSARSLSPRPESVTSVEAAAAGFASTHASACDGLERGEDALEPRHAAGTPRPPRRRSTAT